MNERVVNAVRTAHADGHRLDCMTRLRADGVPLIPFLRTNDDKLCEYDATFAVGADEGHVHLVCGHHDALARRRVYQVTRGRYPDHDPGTGVIDTIRLDRILDDSEHMLA